MLDARFDGCLGAPGFQDFYRMLLNTYMRPIARLLFPETMGYDTQTFGFSINYQPNTDISIRPHSDASSVTLNINVNLPGENFTGSSVDFFDSASGEVKSLTFAPGEGGRVPSEVGEAAEVDAKKRRTPIAAEHDDYAPF